MMQDGSTIDGLRAFITANHVPLVGQLTPENFHKRYTKRPLVIFFYTVDFSFEHRDSKWINALLRKAVCMKSLKIIVIFSTTLYYF